MQAKNKPRRTTSSSILQHTFQEQVQDNLNYINRMRTYVNKSTPKGSDCFVLFFSVENSDKEMNYEI